jgi:hypothetical protein
LIEADLANSERVQVDIPGCAFVQTAAGAVVLLTILVAA